MLPPRDREELRRIGQIRFFAAGTTILRQNECSNYVLIIQTGCVKIVTVTGDGYHTVLALRNAGDLLGELASTDGGPRSATVCALTDVQALAIAASRFEAFRRHRPVIDQAVQRLLTARLRECGRMLATVGAESVVQRLAYVLLCLGDRYGRPEGDGVRIRIPLSQDDLAGLAFTSRRTIGRVLAAWRDLGWVVTSRRNLLILDVAALKALRTP
ncbi:MAG: Crp/Fnr family transcriptional regulator [Dactylosporangium sp.]|nr:Crp/Fnr family transcriptional regulator [Dactylosporangium sp.]